MSLKTLKDLISGRHYDVNTMESFTFKLKKEAITWIKEIRKKHEEHWADMDRLSFDGKEEGYNPYSFEFMGVTFNCWHEASDCEGAVKVLKLMFDISEDELT